MRIQFIIGYGLVGLLALWSLLSGNLEFLTYSVVTAALVLIIHVTDKHYAYNSLVLWGFNLWILLHILGGLYKIDGQVLYSFMLVNLVGAPYSILKYDQIVHAYCYFIVALLLWHIVSDNNSNRQTTSMVLITVLAAVGIGGLNEIVEFLATVFIENVNVGGYENTAIDIIANLLGALAAIPFLQRVKPYRPG